MLHPSVGSNIICEQCNVVFSRKRELRRHIMTALAHSTIREHQCKICHSTFGRKDTLKRHKTSRKCRKISLQKQQQQQQQQHQQQLQLIEQQLQLLEQQLQYPWGQKVSDPFPERDRGPVTAGMDHNCTLQQCMVPQNNGGKDFWYGTPSANESGYFAAGLDVNVDIQSIMNAPLEEGLDFWKKPGLFL